MPFLWRHQEKNPHPNQMIFLIETSRLAETVAGLNSSIAICQLCQILAVSYFERGAGKTERQSVLLSHN